MRVAQPQLHLVGAVGSSGLAQEPLCTIAILKPNLFVADNSAVTAREIASCEAVLRRYPPESHTDVRGALKFAGLSLVDRPTRVRGVTLISDLHEEIAPSSEPAVPELDDTCVLVVQQITPKIGAHPSVVDSNKLVWRRNLSDWGARDVRFLSVPGFSDEGVTSFFSACARGGKASQ